MGTKRKIGGGASRPLKKALAVGLSFAMVLGGVPAPALAEATGDVAAAQEQAQETGELAQVAREVASGLAGETATERACAAYALLAGVPQAAQADESTADVDAEALSALRMEASTPAGVTRAFSLLVAETGLKAVELQGADGSAWAMVEADGEWRHYDPARAAASDDAAWLELTDEQMVQQAPDATPWALADGTEAPKAEAVQVEEQQSEEEQLAEVEQQSAEEQESEEGQERNEGKRPAAQDAQPEGVPFEEVNSQEAAELDKVPEASAQAVADEKPQAGKKVDDKTADENKSDSKAESKAQTPDAKPGLEAQAATSGTLPTNNTWVSFTTPGKGLANAHVLTLVMPGDGKVTIQTRNDGTVDAYWRLQDADLAMMYNPNKAKPTDLDDGIPEGIAVNTKELWLRKGTYKLAVNVSPYADANGKVSVRASYTSAGSYVPRNNFTRDTATRVAIGSTVKGLLTRNDITVNGYHDVETKCPYFRLDVPKAQTLRITVHADCGNHIEFLDKNGVDTRDTFKDTNGIGISSKWYYSGTDSKDVLLASGTYYMKLEWLDWSGTFSDANPGGPYTVTVESLDLSDASVSVSSKSYTYDGKQKTPGVTVKLNGSTLSKGKDYTVSYASGRTNAGSYKVTVKGNGEYAGSKTVTFKINKASVAKASVSGIGNRAYTGKAVGQNPTVKVGGRTLKKGTDYALSYKNNVKAGKATVTITGKGNYTGSISRTFQILPSIKYFVHRQTYGWEKDWSRSNGQQSGTTGESKRLEGIRVRLDGKPVSGSIQYKTHIQTFGWEEGWKSDGQMSGTSGKSKRLEAIQIRLTGNLAKNYDVYYRVHAQHYGWMGWAKNGASAGTAGYSYRLEAIQIVLVPKGAKAPAASYQGATQAVSAPFVKR